MRELEIRLIKQAGDECEWHSLDMAKVLGLSIQGLLNKLVRYDLADRIRHDKKPRSVPRCPMCNRVLPLAKATNVKRSRDGNDHR